MTGHNEDLNALAKEIHLEAMDKGFWDKDRNLGEMLMLIVSELSEALEAHREPPVDAASAFFYIAESGKPEGIITELADAIIRCLDTLYSKFPGHGTIQDLYEERYDFHVSVHVNYEMNPYIISDNFGDNLLKVCDFVIRAKRDIRWLVDVIVFCERLSATLGYDVWQVARDKFAYNKTRARMHGKAY